MGIPVPNRTSRRPSAAVIAIFAVGVLLAAVAGPVVYWAMNNLRPSTSPPVAVVSPSPSPTIAVSPTPSMNPTPAPTASPASVVATLRGKIAISSGQPGSGGWITFPDGTFKADPMSNVALPGGTWGYGLAWNAAMKAWVPVNWYLIRQDGQVYVYPLWDNTGLRVAVMRANGTTYVLGALPQGNGVTFSILSAEPEGVYAGLQSGQGGLWILDYAGGVRAVYPVGFWQLAAFGYAYGTVTPFVPQGATNVVQRLNLKTGAAVDWFSRPGMQSRVVGVTVNGAPVIEATSTTTVEVWLGTQTPKLLHSETFTASPTGGMMGQPGYVVSALGDQVGIWVATNKGLYLYTDKAGWEFASPTTGILASTIQ